MEPLTAVALRARDGDRASLEEFIRLTQADVFGLCRYLGDPDTAEDLTQETYERAIRSLGSIREDSNPRAWILTIARRACADSVRRRVRKRRLTETLKNTGSRGIDERDSGSASWIEIDDLVYGLSDDRRAAFVLTQLLGFRYHEAAGVLGCPIGTVRSRVARAREDLIAALDGDSRRGVGS